MKCLLSFALGCLDPILSSLSGDQTPAGPGGVGRGEDGEIGVWRAVDACAEIDTERAGRRRNARYWHLLPAVHMHGV